MFMNHDDTDSSLMLGRAAIATGLQHGSSQTKATRSEGPCDVHALQGAAADEFPPGFAEFAAARAREIAIARTIPASAYEQRRDHT